MNCQETEQLILDAFETPLSAAERESIDEHCSHCSACAQFAVVRRKLQGPIEARKRLGAALQHLQRKSARVPGLRIIGFQEKILLVGCRRLVRAFQQRQ